MNAPMVYPQPCTGPNFACRAAHRTGLSVHVIPAASRYEIVGDRARLLDPILVLPTYHFLTAQDGIEFIHLAERTAPTVATDDDLYAYRARGIAHYLPVGWTDPTRRTGS